MTQRREKASDNFKPWLGTTSDFERAFPTIAEVRVECTFAELGEPDRGSAVYTQANLPGEFINCRNPLCYNGGFSIGAILRDAEYRKETTIDATEFCQGYEGSPKGRRKYRECLARFRVKGTVRFKETSSG